MRKDRFRLEGMQTPIQGAAHSVLCMGGSSTLTCSTPSLGVIYHAAISMNVSVHTAVRLLRFFCVKYDYTAFM
jgi:hypothetical protein